MGDMMTFPASVEEFMEQYKMTDTEHVYSNGTEYVPIYRMKQWFEHCRNQQRPTIDAVPVVRCKDCKWGKTWKNAFGIEGFKCDLLFVDLSPEAFCSYGEYGRNVLTDETEHV